MKWQAPFLPVYSSNCRYFFVSLGPRHLMNRFICIHAHFYQPPRENPWLEAVELQESAYPYHDWNQRISAECYAPNSSSRILNARNRIAKIVNNYSRISFNFGPTLLSWMEENDPETYQCIIDSDKKSQKRFSGHGSAIAQGYNHMILPLANTRDKHTQVLWGIRDFERRFGRYPEGMWLPETAVDLETLEVLAEHGIRFTVLAPRQAGKIRKIGGRSWKDISGGRIDPTRAYLQKLPSGAKINLFFYDGPISQAVAFEKLLNSGEQFASRLQSGFSDARDWPQLMHIATDGETYGHHHRHGDMALAYALHHIQQKSDVRLINYGEFLEKFPPTHEVQIIENTSWSCFHGIERWGSNCGCNSGREGWDQEWRGPLRAALNDLRDRAAAIFEHHGGELLRDPWAARNDYIDVILDRSPEALWIFFEKHSKRELKPEETVKTLMLLEMERHAMLMFTSCGWFFDEISGIETVQVIQYAGRVIQLAHEISGEDLEPDFLKLLANAKSNLPEMDNGAQLYNLWIKPAVVDLCKVGAHFAISSVFESSKDGTPKFCYEIKIQDHRKLDSGAARLGLGRIRVTSQITRESRDLVFGVVHAGDEILHAGVRDFRGDDDYQQVVEDTVAAFSSGDSAETLALLDRYFDEMQYSLKSLFKDEQKRILDLILSQTLRDAEENYREIYRRHGPLLHFLKEMNQPMPKILRTTAEFVLNTDLRRTLQSDPVDAVRAAMLMELVKREGIRLDEAGLAFAARNSLNKMMRKLQQEPHNIQLLDQLNVFVAMLQMLRFQIDYWEAQNIYYAMLKRQYAAVAKKTDSESRLWAEKFLSLGEKLQVSIPLPEPQPELQMAS
jgi:alpha-amylase/alpha-mannosidase (GH57 family)